MKSANVPQRTMSCVTCGKVSHHLWHHYSIVTGTAELLCKSCYDRVIKQPPMMSEAMVAQIVQVMQEGLFGKAHTNA